MATAAIDSPSTVLRLHLDSKLFEAYEIQARESGIEVEELIAKRLLEFRDQDTFKGRKLLLSPPERQDIEKLFSRSFKTGADLVRFLSDIYSLRLNDVKIPVSGQVLQRLKDRCGQRRKFSEFVQEVVVKGLEHFVGLR